MGKKGTFIGCKHFGSEDLRRDILMTSTTEGPKNGLGVGRHGDRSAEMSRDGILESHLPPTGSAVHEEGRSRQWCCHSEASDLVRPKMQCWPKETRRLGETEGGAARDEDQPLRNDREPLFGEQLAWLLCRSKALSRREWLPHRFRKRLGLAESLLRQLIGCVKDLHHLTFCATTTPAKRRRCPVESSDAIASD
jgi:hypothetical protein